MNDKKVILLQGCTFSRNQDDLVPNGDLSNDSFCLENVSCAINIGELVGVIGPMGSGKSTFIEAIAGEHLKISGKMELNDRAIHVSNNPWLISGTIRENILFGADYVSETYDRIVRACGLNIDFNRLHMGDLTWINGNGDDISGGQKQRISLARAVYRNCPIYLLDDPLSAVDPRLRRSIFKEVIGPEGLLRKKTRVVILNDYSFVDAMDKIIMLRERTVTDIGTLTELKSRHDLDLEVWKADNDFEQNHTSEKPRRLRPVMKRQNTVKNILKSMKSRDFDRLDDLAFESVTTENYLYYIRSMGIFGISVALLGYLTSQAFEVASKLWLAAWTSKQQQTMLVQTSLNEEDNFILVYGTLGISQAFSYLAAVLISNRRTLSASFKIHQNTFHNVVLSKLEFIWSNQVGAVANRFSRDMTELDINLPNTLKNFILQCMRILGTIFLVIFTFPLNVFTLIPFLFIISLIFARYIRISRLLRRLASSTMSNLNSLVTEHVNGSQTIRTYR